MHICNTCVLPASFPGIAFNEEGKCSFCQGFAGKERKLAEDKKRYEEKFRRLLDKTANSRLTTDYDVLMAFSGGKDSTYAMYLLNAKYKLRIFALSFDNGFISETARQNIRNVTDRLGIDHVFFKPKWNLLKSVFTAASANELFSAKSLERASTICTACIGLVKSVCLKTALEKGIPMIGFGWSPGQAPVQSALMKNNPALIKMNQRAVAGPLRTAVGPDIDAYFLNEGQYSLPHDRFPYNVHPMAWEFYEEGMIVETIQELGWAAPQDTDTNSSNCLLNAYANEVHIAKYGFHPYAWEIANMVREGVMSRKEGFEKIYSKQRKDLVDYSKKVLGM